MNLLKFRIYFLTIIFCSFVSHVCAQQTFLSWEDCVRIAREHNPSYLSSVQSFKSSGFSYRASLNGIFPQVDLSTRYSDSDSNSENSKWRGDGEASLNVFDMKTYSQIKSASAQEQKSKENLNLVSSIVRSDLRNAFVKLIFSQEQLVVAEKIRDIRRNNSEMVTLKYNSGRESKGNMLQSNAEYKGAEADLSQAKRSLKVAQIELNRHLGSDHFDVIFATGSLDVRELLDDVDMKTLSQMHPQVIVQKGALLQSKAALQEAKSSLWPTLSASYSRSVIGKIFFPSDSYAWGVSGILNYPLFSGGPTATYNRTLAARANLRSAEMDYEAIIREVRSQLESSWATLAGSVDKVEVQYGFLTAARQRNQEASIRYSSGLMSYEDWQRVVSDLVNFERGFISAKRDSALAEADWNRSQGLQLENP
ncbi:MAG: TolC family protein [Elusimicrobiota bacterium]